MSQELNGEYAAGHGSKPLNALLVRLGARLSDIASSVDRTQSIIAGKTWPLAAHDPDYISSMQTADLHAQKISGIAELVMALAEHVPGDLAVNTGHLKQWIKIAALHDVLDISKNDKEPSAAMAGEFDLL